MVCHSEFRITYLTLVCCSYDDDIETGDVITVPPEPLYHTVEEEGNDEEICEQEVSFVPGFLDPHTVQKM